MDPSNRKAAVNAFQHSSKPTVQVYAPTSSKQLSNLNYLLKRDKTHTANITTLEDIRIWAIARLVSTKT